MSRNKLPGGAKYCIHHSYSRRKNLSRKKEYDEKQFRKYGIKF